MNSIFFDCNSLSFLHDISKGIINNVIDISYMLYDFKLLSFLPDISKWNINNINNMKSILSSCISLLSLLEISN